MIKITGNKKFFAAIMFLLSVFTGISLAGPEIQVDSAFVNVGIVNEGKTPTISHVYKITNTGDSLLVINSVPTECGCTMINYDTLIPPGQTKLLTAKIDIKELSDYGEYFGKKATIFSNAIKTPAYIISVSGTILRPVYVKPEFIQMYQDSVGKCEKLITLITNKPDLNILSIIFRNDNTPLQPSNSAGNSAAHNYDTIPLNYAIVHDSVEQQGFHYHYLKLQIALPYPILQTIKGVLTFTTNHPDLPEINRNAILVYGFKLPPGQEP
jgi:hypothetical protein